MAVSSTVFIMRRPSPPLLGIATLAAVAVLVLVFAAWPLVPFLWERLPDRTPRWRIVIVSACLVALLATAVLSQRWLRWPSGLGWLIAAAWAMATLAVSLIAGGIWLVLGLPSLETATSVSPKALDTVATRSFAVVAGLVGVALLSIAYKRQSGEETKLFTERFTTAVSQLGEDQAAVRLGGVHALAHLADDAPDQGLRQMCVDVLCAYLRNPTPADLPEGTTPDQQQAHHERVVEHATMREVRLTIVRTITQRIRNHTVWINCDFDFTGVTFEHTVDFTGVTFDGRADFSNTTFTRESIFSGAVFNGLASFSGSTFINNAAFVGSTFARGGMFTRVAFGKGAIFAEARFKNGAGFAKSTFAAGAVFSGVKFEGGAGFAGVIFSESASFSGAAFSRGANFTGARFSVSAGFEGTVFAERVDLSGSYFSAARFTRATFAGGASFTSADFSRVSDFKGAIFSSHVGFEGVAFAGRVDFSAAIFKGGVDFLRAIFTKGADFSGSTFSKRAGFTEANFLENSPFERASFPNDADFTGAGFGAGGDFQGADPPESEARGLCPEGLVRIAEGAEGRVRLPYRWAPSEPSPTS